MLIPLYATALFVSAFLLFWVQPLFAKLVLPLLGGTPAVWNTVLMVFQALLLVGYGYAHLLNRYVRPARQFWIHGALLLLVISFLPIRIASGWTPPTAGSPVFWLIGLLVVSIGIPFAVLSASAPLLQSWFARTGHRLNSDPYFLYAASNSGSLLALLAFPFLLEPALTLTQQSRGWMMIYGVLLVFVGLCVTPLLRRGTIAVAPRQFPSEPASVSNLQDIWRQRAIWIALAFVPSSLMLGVTSYLSTDVASVPLLWVIPLALYLLSFIVAFARKPLIDLQAVLKAQAMGIVLVTLTVTLSLLFRHNTAFPVAASIHLSAFFFTALACHMELARRRPSAARTTEFYFCMSIGGAIGGVFNALIAPLIFSSAYEYYLGLVAACALRAVIGERPRQRSPASALVPVIMSAVVAAAAWYWSEDPNVAIPARLAFMLPVGFLLYSFSPKPMSFTIGVGGLLATMVLIPGSADLLHQERSFFGVYKIATTAARSRIELFHGTTMHGSEFVDPTQYREPLSYYARSGPLGQIFAARSDLRQVALIGLGTGALACYRRPGEAWTFFEIDPAIERIARDTRWFHYLDICGQGIPVVLGDGRLSLRAEQDSSFDAIVVDAFSSDAIPMHLLTQQAMQVYLRKLKPHGILVLHISNLYLRLSPVVAALAASVNAVAREQLFQPSRAESIAGASPSDFVIVARDDTDLAFLDPDRRWSRLPAPPGARAWTDDYSNIVDAIIW